MNIKMNIYAVLMSSIIASFNTYASPVAIYSPSYGASTFSFFTIDTKKLGIPATDAARAKATSDLKNELAKQGTGILPCIVQTDSNANISCPMDGLNMTVHWDPVPLEFFTYNGQTNLSKLSLITNKKGFNNRGGYNQVWAANFKSPVGTIAGDSKGRIAHVNFPQAVTEFSFLVDGGQASYPSVQMIQFVVNGSPISLPIVPGTPTVVGVQDDAGFTSVEIQADPQDINSAAAFVADRFSFLVK